VVVVATALSWVLLRALRPDMFAAEPAWPAQWREYLTAAFLHFDLGQSRAIGQPVAVLVREGVPADLSLFTGGLVFGLLSGLAGGTLAAGRGRGAAASAAQLGGMAMFCSPVYVTGMSVLLLFGAGIAVIDVGVGIPVKYVAFGEGPGRWLGALIAPWIVLGLPLAGLTMRMMYAATREALGEEPVRTARAKGVASRSILFGHAAPLGAGPALALASASANLMLTNMILTERVFQVPGLFQLLPRAVARGDAPLLLALTMVGAAFIALTTAVLDVVLAAVDPRVRQSR
jgi:peptide/nickel transport system permease protein